MAVNRNNIIVEPAYVYWNGTNLGYIDGAMEITSEEMVVDVVTHQNGSNVIDGIRTGKNVEVKIVLKETSTTQINTLLAVAGSTLTVATAEVTSITCVADAAGSLNNKYFYINSALNAVQYYVWFNVNSAGTDPLISGKTAVPVALATGATASAVATAVASALDALAGFVTTASSAVVTNTNAVVGSTTDAVDVSSGFTIEVTTQGSDIGNVGWGTGTDFANQYVKAKVLNFHPVNLAASVLTRDLNIWKAYPMLESINFSGEDIKTLPVTFKVFYDPARPTGIDYYAFGAAY